jgi:hypothetical protein
VQDPARRHRGISGRAQGPARPGHHQPGESSREHDAPYHVGRARGVSNLVAAGLLAARPDAGATRIVFIFSAAAMNRRADGELVHGS